MPGARNGFPNRSPWLEQLGSDEPPRPLDHDADTDVVVVGAGIAGVSTAFFTMRDTSLRVLLLERDRVGRGASGHNAGQLVTYFERPLSDLVETFGFEAAIAAQAGIDGTWELLDTMIAQTGASVRIDRFVGHMGMFSANHVLTHLRNNQLRRQGDLELERCVVSERAPFLAELPPELADLYEVVPQTRVRELLGASDDSYWAVLSHTKGCGNSALLCKEVLAHLVAANPGRFAYADHSPVDRIVLDEGRARIEVGDRHVTAARVVLCTNGFVDHVIENRAGPQIQARLHQRISGTIGYMAGFVEPTLRPPAAISYIRNQTIGTDGPYFYMTRRRHDGPQGPASLTCIGGPELEVADVGHYEQDAEVPAAVIEQFDDTVLPIIRPDRAPGLGYDYTRHGLMAYTDTRLRLIGVEPRNPVLHYNLGCNGVGFMPSVYGGHRIGRLLAGDALGPSLFDPT